MSPNLKRTVFQLMLLMLLLLIVEIALRWMGHQPGDLKPKWLQFTPVDSLREDNLFYTNQKGILIANKERWAKENIYINADGFRNKEFAKIDSTKKKILLIGDSYVWGSSARPMVGNCFADLLRSETNYEVINLGIQAVDPAQYSQLAEEYVPTLKPDMLLVFFYMGNDLMKEDRASPKGKPFVYVTNAGVITAYDGKQYFKTAAEAFNYFVNEKYFLKHPENFAERIISKSSLLSMLYSIRFRWSEKQAYENVVKNSSIAKKYLYQIKEVCHQYHTPVKLVLIPEMKEADMDTVAYKQRYENLLKDSLLQTDWIIPHPKKSFYRDLPDGHLNNEGHRYYADFLKSYLQKEFAEKN